MSLRDRLTRIRAVLAAGSIARALGFGMLASMTVVLATALVDRATPLAPMSRMLLLVIAAAAGIATLAALLWRDRAVWSVERVALWIEEQQPSLRYALVSALEFRNEDLVSPAIAAEWSPLAARRAARGALLPLVALMIAFALTIVLPSGAIARLSSPRIGDSLDRATARSDDASRLTPMIARIALPAYAGGDERSIDEPTDVSALVGSALTLEGKGDATGIVAISGRDTIYATATGERWRIPFRVGTTPVTIRLTDRGYQRIVAVEPTPDAPPVVTLSSPAHDSVLRQPRGSVLLEADVSDDFAVATASFEYIVSSGEGESFTFKSGTLGAIAPRARHGSLRATIPLGSLKLKPGDIVHIRAVARDANDVSGPGIGSSETRAIRIARADEYDSVAVEAAAPSETDKSFVSQRMLIMLAEALEKRRAKLSRDTLVRESRAIAVDQKKLRGTVSEVLFGKVDSAVDVSVEMMDIDDEADPGIAVNKPLLEAYNAMWDAGTQLEVGEPGKALPFMRRALAAIERARQAQRLYLRGRPPQIVLDLSKARLKGKDKGTSSTRTPLSAVESAQRALAERFLRALELAERNQAAATDSLLVLRIDALPANATFAAALGDAAMALRRGRGDDATAAFVRARRALSGVPVVRDSIARWGIVP